MPEGSMGITEFRSSSPPGPSNEPNQLPHEGQPQARISLAQRLKDVVARRILSEQPFRPEDYTEPRIASDILTYTRNSLRARIGSNPYVNTFNKGTILSNKGQDFSIGKPDSDAYQAVSQALEELVGEGALDADYEDESYRGEHRYYRVKDPDLLREIAERTNQQQAQLR